MTINLDTMPATTPDAGAVARLDTPITDATPYQLAPSLSSGAPMKFVARGHVQCEG